jgi:hypothetical protein
VHEIHITDSPPLPFSARDDRLVVHGGGWGIGTYQSRAEELARAQLALDLVIHDKNEAIFHDRGDRCFQMDPDWHPWVRNAEGRLEFPPLGEVTKSRETSYRRNPPYHELHDVIRRSKAIVSKPGGCTLIDSLSSATPVVLLEPYGAAEESNGLLWQHLGFGISYADWKQAGFDPSSLHRLHSNLLSRCKARLDYAAEVAR